MADRRTAKSKQAIEETFFELLKAKKSLNKITVSEITRIANLGRGTFYLHYQDVYDLYNKTEARLFDEIINIFKKSFPSTNPENSKQMTKELTEYINENKERFCVLIQSNTNAMQNIKKNFNEIVLTESQEIHNNVNSKFDYVEAVFVVSGIIGVLEQWIVDEMKMPKEEIANMLNKILLKINNQFAA